MTTKNKKGGRKSPLQKEINGMTATKYVCPVCKQIFTEDKSLRDHLKGYFRLNSNQRIITLKFQNYIPKPPNTKDQLQQTYSASDSITIETWFEEWKINKLHNMANYDVLKNTGMKEYKKWISKPVIIAGSGPSLKYNAELLKERNEIGLVSALHNFGFFESIGVKPDYYINLDAGDVTMPECAEGNAEVYEKMKDLSLFNKIAYLDEIKWWDKTKDHTLITALHGNPQLHKRWQGRMIWINTSLPQLDEEINHPTLNKFNLIYQTGGNTLGACHYHAKAILGGNPVVFVGADFAFSNDNHFHAWDSPYDKKVSGIMKCTDIFGNHCLTWPSYYGFKCWFEFIAMGGKGNAPGSYINCTEGGILGAYPEGNIIQIRQKTLKSVLTEYNLHRYMPVMLKEQKNTVLY